MFDSPHERNEWLTAILFQQSLLKEPPNSRENRIQNFKRLIENNANERQAQSAAKQEAAEDQGNPGSKDAQPNK